MVRVTIGSADFQFSAEAFAQLLVWAAAYVDNETGIRETPTSQLGPDEREALAVLQAFDALAFPRRD